MASPSPDLLLTRRKLPRNLPWFDGHFPDRPVLPGVALLSMFHEMLRAEGRDVAGFARIRFRREIFPGDEIVFEAGAGHADTLRFTIKRGETLAADGLTLLRRAGADDEPSQHTASVPIPDPALPPIEMLLPHRGAMRFLEGLVVSTPQATTATALVDPSSPFAHGSLAPTVLAIEIAAQAAAAAESLARFGETGVAAPREGRLVGASEVALHAAGIPVGRPLSVSIALAHSLPPMSIYDATVADGHRVLATGRVSTYLV